ncbi:MAG: extracellular solute-binding protein [Nitriliruptorales bacterium]|nr:extracellular solute-binding protein [Nitriliruptorales bacterium]
MSRSLPRAALVSLAMLLMAAACGGPDSPAAAPTDEGLTATESTVEDVLAAVEGLEAEERRAELMRMAENEEGPVLVYTSFTLMTDILDVLEASLQEATGLDMEIYRADGEAVRARLVQEAAAGRRDADVIETAGRMLEQLATEGLIAAYESPHLDELIEGAAHENWDATRLNVYSVAWNTNEVSEDDRPHSYEELADDPWAGRLTLEPTDYDWFWSVSNHWAEEKGMSEEEIDALWQQIAGNADFVSGHTSTVELVGAGEYSVMASAFAPTVERFNQEGQAVAWRPPVEPLFATPNAASIYKHTTRPASSVLFMDWLFSDAMDIFSENEIFVTRADLQNPILEGLDIRIIDVSDYLPQEEAVMEEYDALAR